MQTAPNQFAHVFLFACPICYRPIVTVCNSGSRSLEVADSHEFHSVCYCGWNGTLLGVQALKHWLEPWTDKAPVGVRVQGSCEE
jgi:hypothetical protein